MKKPKNASNMIISQIFKHLSTDSSKEDFELKFEHGEFKKLLGLIEDGKINMNLAKSALDKMIETGKPVSEVIDEKDMGGVDDGELTEICKKVVAENQNAVNDYKNGKEAAFKSLVGGVMKATRGKANPVRATEIITGLINE